MNEEKIDERQLVYKIRYENATDRKNVDRKCNRNVTIHFILSCKPQSRLHIHGL